MIKHASIIITLTSAILYALGLTYYQSYLQEFGVDETQFPLSIDRVLFQGFVSSASMGSKALMWFYLTALGVVAVAVLGTVIIKFVKNHKLLEFIQKHFSSMKEENNEKNGFLNFSSKVFEYVSGIFIVFLGGLLVLIFSANIGTESAKNIITKCNNGELKKNIVYLENSEQQVTGCSIVCNSSQCAYLVKGETFVINKEGKIYSKTKL